MIKFLKLKIIFASLIIGGCATGGFQGDVVSRDAAGKQQFVQTGVVVSLQNVTIEGDREVGATSGTVLGAIVGGSAAERAADGDGDTSEAVGGIIGALIGSVVGSEVGEAISRKAGLEIIIRLDSNDREISVVQEVSENSEQQFRVGDKVRVVRSSGRSRVVLFD